MNDRYDDAIKGLKEAVCDLENELSRVPERARPGVQDRLNAVLGISYTIHVVTRITQDISHIKRQQEVTEESGSTT